MGDVFRKGRVLLVDDEEGFRRSLASRLELRGFRVVEAADGHQAVRQLRSDPTIDVILLDKNMPRLDGMAALQELKRFRPEVPVIMLTGFGSLDTAVQSGREGIFRYLHKPVRIEELVRHLDAALGEKHHARARLAMPEVRRHGSRWRWLGGSPNLRPGVILLGLVLLVVAGTLPVPGDLHRLLDAPKTGDRLADTMAGYPGYGKMPVGQSIAERYRLDYAPPGLEPERAPEDLGRRALLMVGLVLVAALFWATGAMPLGVTALVVAGVMYGAGIMKPDAVAQAFAKDAVVFIFGVLVLSRCLSATGLDRRLAMLLLMPVRNLGGLLFIFLPTFALTCSFINETILIALLMPLFITVHGRVAAAMPTDGPGGNRRSLLVLFGLMLCFASNLGGPGSPAAGGRNAIMVGILADYGQPPTFLQWMKYGLPFVPVAALALGGYFYLVFGRCLAGTGLDVAAIARQGSRVLGPMNREEKATAWVGLMVVGGWILASGRLGMGGPVMLGLVLLNLLGVLKWKQISEIPWDVVFLYAGASALGKGLAETGGALYLAREFVGLWPQDWFIATGGGTPGSHLLPMMVSLFTGLLTNIMSDGATVAAVGPMVVPMARDAGLHPWVLGFATAFASSFPHMLIIGTPGNALVYILGKDPASGRQLVTQRDFLVHGFAVFVLSYVVLWLWTFLGYWRWLGFPSLS